MFCGNLRNQSLRRDFQYLCEKKHRVESGTALQAVALGQDVCRGMTSETTMLC
jgi:hypothetical protein